MPVWGGAGNFAQDTYIEESAPDTNYGSNSDLLVAYDNTGKTALQAYICADVDFSPSGGEITSSNVTSAYIYMYCHTRVVPPATTVWAIKLDNTTWDEDVVTWNTPPTPYDPNYYSDKVAPASGWTTWDVWTAGNATSLLKDAIDNESKILRMCFRWIDLAASTVHSGTFYSSDEPTHLGSLPYLIINYTTAAGADAFWVQIF